MKIRLGFVAISETLSDITSSSTITYSYYQKLSEEMKYRKLEGIILKNLKNLQEILKYNVKNNITLYRMTSHLIPFLTRDDVYINLDKYEEEFKKIGEFLKDNKIRLGTHPDQYCLLNSVSNTVVENSIKILESQIMLFEKMGYNGYMIIHVGSASPSKEEAIKRFIDNFQTLDDRIKGRILLENDDKIFTITDVLNICSILNIPMVLDYHHYVCNNNGEKIEDYIDKIFNTWGEDTPKIHFSSPKSIREKRSHHDYINEMDFIKFLDNIKFIKKDIDIMIEAKKKDEAMFRLIRMLKYKTNYQFINDTTFLIN